MIAALITRPVRTISLAILSAGIGTAVGTWLHLWWTEGDL